MLSVSSPTPLTLVSWLQRNKKYLPVLAVLAAILIGISLASFLRTPQSCLCGPNQICEQGVCKDIITSSTLDAPGEQSLIFETLKHGTHSLITTKQEAVIDNDEAWLEFWEKHQTGYFPSLTGGFAPSSVSLPQVDFTKELVIAVYMGEQRTGGYDITIEGITLNKMEAEVEVTVTVTRPNPQDIVTQVLTQPFHMVKVQKPNTPVRFRFVYE